MSGFLRISALSLVFALLSCSPHVVAKENQKPPAQQDAATKALDAFLLETKKQMDQLHIILSSISSMINDEQIIPNNKKDTLKNIQEINSFIQMFQHKTFINADISTLDLMLNTNRLIINHVQAACKNGFANFKTFDPTPIIKRKPTGNINPKKLEALLNKNKKDLTQLVKKAETAGLKWYNIIYRKFDKYVVEPCVKYSIPSRALIGTAALTAALLSWWYIDSDNFLAKVGGKDSRLGKFFGQRPKWDRLSSEVTNEKELGLFGKTEYYASLLLKKDLPITATIGSFAMLGMYEEYKILKPKFDKQMKVWTNKLKGGAYLKEAQKAAEIVDEVYFDDLIGLNHIKAHFKQIVDYLENPESFDRLGLTPAKGILLIGETRTGKSYSIKALFGEINRMLKKHGREKEFNYLHLDAPKIIFFGIGDILKEIKRKAPCIVFIDEIDLLDLQRKGKNEMLSEFLTYMSGVTQSKDPKNQVIIIGATNMPETLDSALRQPGRFAVELVYTYPDFEQRKYALAKNLQKLSLDIRHFDLDRLARQTEGQSHEALNMIIRNAVINARVNGEVISQEHIEHTIDEELRHIVTHSSPQIADHQKRMLSAHFAGHALALHLLDTYTKLSKVTIKDVKTNIKEEIVGFHLFNGNDKDELADDGKQQRLEHGKVFTEHPDDSIDLLTRDEKIALIKFHLAGIIAEEIILGSCGFSCHRDDKKVAFQLAQSIIDEGLDVSKAPKEVQRDIFQRTNAMIEECKQDIKELLTEHESALKMLTDALCHFETLSQEQVESITYLAEHPEELEKMKKMEELIESGLTPEQAIAKLNEEADNQQPTDDTPSDSQEVATAA